MPRFKVAHMRHKTDDLIVVQMEKSFGLKTSVEMGQVIALSPNWKRGRKPRASPAQSFRFGLAVVD
jgi:hypothetical protein